MVNRPLRSGKSSSIHDANSSVPEYITQALFQKLEALPACRKTSYLMEQVRTKFVSKETDPASVLRERAIAKWLSVEKNNEATNDRLISTDEEYNILPRLTWSRFLAHAQGVVSDIIGETVSEDVLQGAFSGGASTSRKRTESHPAQKYLGKADVTTAAHGYFSALMEEYPVWSSFSDDISINVVEGNELFTVPKNTTIDRVAAKEPDINMFLQKGVGNYFRRSLRKKGINLNDQTRNRDLAREGSITGLLATLDLSSASDSVTRSLVELLLPTLWFSYLSELRSPVTMIDGERHVNEMFSSMGNGFTFELESLLFYALAKTTAYFEGVSGVISVYGDDIICPSVLAEPLIWVLGYCGFSVNPDKSFWTGSFRESCGGHFDNGYDITPFYIRKPIEKLIDVIHTANSLREWAKINDGVAILDPTVEPLWRWLAEFVPRCFWGGHDTSDKNQLVAPTPPLKRLVAITRAKRVSQEGLYLQWLNATLGRDTSAEAIETSDVTENGLAFRSRPVCKFSHHRYRSVIPFHTEL